MSRDFSTTSRRRLLAIGAALIAAVTLASAGPAHATIRAAFEYQWYPENSATHYTPDLMPAWPYASGDAAVVDRQIDSMMYGGIQAGISSWWGQGHSSDARFASVLAETEAHSPGATGFKQAIYYEAEGGTGGTVPGAPNPTAAQITSDLDYIASNYASSPSYLKLNGRPVIFAYGDGGDGCGMVDRWTQANAAATTRFYVVLKVFGGYTLCANQPDSWHQYAGAAAEDVQGKYSISISPGFWHANEATPRLARDPARWQTNVQHMAAFTGDWQLTYWNEWVEGTAVESATAWDSATGNGTYDARLHTWGQALGTAPPVQCADGLDNDFDGLNDTADPDCTGATDSTESGGSTAPPPPPPPSSGACGSMAGQAPHITKVVWIWFENHAYTSITPTAAPYFNQIKAQCGYASNYHSVTNFVSLPEYLAATSGSNQGVTDDANPASHPLNVNNLFRQLDQAGKTWHDYEESMPSNCLKTTSGSYAPKHNPAAYYTGASGSESCATNDVPLGASPTFGWDFTRVEPNLCNSMHDCSVTTGDNWLKGMLPKVINSADYQAGNTAVLITFDEGAGGNETLFTLAMSEYTRPGTVSSTAFNHYSLLRTTQNLLGLGCLLNSCTAASMAPAFGMT